MNKKNRQVIEEFRANDGNVIVRPPNGPILLLHTRGARTGRPCLTPLIYRQDGERFVILASRGGWKTNPAWYYNLRAHPNAWIEVGSRLLPVTATIERGEARQELFDRHAEAYPQFAFYQGKTSRRIPVITLTPAEPHGPPPDIEVLPGET